MINDIPINKSPLLTEWFDTGYDQGTYHAWIHGKNCADSSCRCIALLHAVCKQIEIEEDWKVFITRVGWLSGFAVARDQESSPSLGDDQVEGDHHA
jgi:hypothetical protein